MKSENMIAVPAHRPIGKGMVRTIIREADLSVDESSNLLYSGHIGLRLSP